MTRRHPSSTLFPYTTLFRSECALHDAPRLLRVAFPALEGLAIEKRHRVGMQRDGDEQEDRKSTRLNSSHQIISYAVFCLKKKKYSQTDGSDLQCRNLNREHS